jgi:magnesium chelatase family protein
VVAHVNTVAFQGVDVVGIDCQVQMASGMPVFTVVGPSRPKKQDEA